MYSVCETGGGGGEIDWASEWESGPVSERENERESRNERGSFLCIRLELIPTHIEHNKCLRVGQKHIIHKHS